MPSGTLVFFVISALPCVLSQISLSLSAPSVVKPSQSMMLTCKVTGVPITDGNKIHAVNFIRQDAGYKFVFLAHLNYDQGSAYNPSLSSRITLSRDTTKNEVYLQIRSLETDDSATYFCTAQKGWGYFDVWGNGQSVYVSTATQQAPSLFPLISCDKSQDSITSIGCLAKDFFPADIKFSWTDKSNSSYNNGLKEYNPILQSGGVFIASSQVQVPTTSWANHDVYYCTAKHSDISKTVKLGNSEPSIPISKPVVTMHAPVKDDMNVNDNGTIVCLASDFSPGEIKINWLKNHVGTTTLNNVTEKAYANANGYYTVSSYITVSKKDWNEDTVYSCVVEHSASGFYEIKNVSKSQACEASAIPGTIQVTVVPPSFETIFLQSKAPLICEISNMLSAEGLSVSWYEEGTENKLSTILDNPVFQDGSFYATATTVVCPEDWLKKAFECRVRHPDLTSPMKVTLAKDNDQEPQTPTIILYGPHQDELNKKEGATFVCLVKGFAPKDAFVKWSIGDQVQERFIVTTKPMVEPFSSSKKTYFLYSTLTVTSTEDWNSGKSFTCTVGHESLPLNTSQKTIDKTTGKPTSVNVSLVMSDSC